VVLHGGAPAGPGPEYSLRRPRRRRRERPRERLILRQV
jgi:hypothetical protein